jgi:hypothetical protein
MENNDIYDISKYTDKQLYDILDISNPTDRELEAKILHLIRKYTNIQNEDGERLRKFFEDIYDRFFQNDDDDNEDEKPTIEGFDNEKPTPEKPTLYVGPTAMIKIPEIDETINDKSEKKDKKDDGQKTKSQLVTNAEYVPDSLRLNPLLKQSIKRIICIDSQYRDVSIYPNTNNFSFDLSEPLRDVVSLKLYSIQIPYTWYTISKSYGSNFFYLKGQTDGINNGLHDYKIEIPAGNYTSDTLVKALNDTGIKSLLSKYPDTSFNNTNIIYNPGNSITTISVDIQKTYTEPYYTLQFPSWTPSVSYIDQNGNTAPLSDVSRNTSIPCYFGFNYDTYSPSCIFSSQTKYTTSIINSNSIKKNYKFDASNNYFTVVQYIGPYNNAKSKIINTYTITLYDTIYNTGNPVISAISNTINYSYSRTEIITMVNQAIQNAQIFTSDSQISQYDISGLVINANNTCFKLKLMFDRNKVMYQHNSKISVIFPTEDPTKYENYTVWTAISDSCFYFNSTTNDFAVLTSELPIVQSNFNTENAYVTYHCYTPSYMINPGNDFSFNIPLGDYTLNQYIQQLNNSLQQITSSVSLNTDSGFSITNSTINCIMDFSKTFTEKNYMVNYDTTSMLCSTLNFTPTQNLQGSDINGNYPLETINTFTFSFPISYAGYILDTSYIMTILPNSNSTNKNEPPQQIYLPQTIYPNYTQLIAAIQSAITSKTIVNSDIQNIQSPYSQSFITYDADINTNTVAGSLTLKINYKLEESNYIMSFYPQTQVAKNPWYILGIDASYNLYNYTSNSSGKLPYSLITGSKKVNQNQINITKANNSILINPNYDPSGGAYTQSGSNDIKLTIPVGNYTIYDLCIAINAKFNANPYTYGSNISIELNTVTNTEYIQLLLNINRIYTSADYNIVFFDPFSFVSCNSNIQGGIQGVTWDTTIGWILGYRDYTSYQLTFANQTKQADPPYNLYYSNSINSIYECTQKYSDSTNVLLINTQIQLSADTTLTTSLYNYFVISLDDYNQNHINDGLVTITRSQTSLAEPGYANTSKRICDPVTNKLVNQSDAQSNLTANQIYAINQANASRNATTPIYSAGPYIKDLFAYVPIKPGTNGTYFIEYGGGLQAQERLYFGPVNIRKMSIQLMNDRGDFLDLNGSNWSFSFICEQLYRSGNSSSNK